MKFSDSLKKNSDFQRVYHNGCSYANRLLVMYVMKNHTNENRIGISVSKKLGNAVFRNKYKRKLRSIIDNYRKIYNNGEDYIIILRRGGVEKSFQDLERDFLNLMKR